jgi:hypothetical protein
MSDQFWLTKAQLERIEPIFPRKRGVPRADDRRVPINQRTAPPTECSEGRNKHFSRPSSNRLPFVCDELIACCQTRRQGYAQTVQPAFCVDNGRSGSL